ncbi:MAG: NADH-quinone oxidoreductase subunit NuoH [Phycisphaerales bacterium]|nr:MAG: NADH-quinone oxidoreductase subunit NuoH [Phycisphaerales bacterium]
MAQYFEPWAPRGELTNYGVPGKAVVAGVVIFVASIVGLWISQSLLGGHPLAILCLFIAPLLLAPVCLAVAFFVKTWRTWRAWWRVLRKFALFVLIIAVVASCIGVFVTNALFLWVQDDLVAQADDQSVSTWFGAPLTVNEISGAMPGGGISASIPDILAILLWPLQYTLVRDVISLVAIIIFFCIVPVFLIWWERKVAGRIQSRLGPMRVGLWHGWAQSPADGIKCVTKEDLVPKDADGPLFRVAPYFALIPSAAAFMALPFGATYIFRDLDVSVVVILALLGVEVMAVILGGWASNNKWSVYGGMREACQMISYEIPMGMALLVPIVCVGSLSLKVIGESQSGGWFTWLAFANPFTFAAFICYFIASLASCKRAPFDLPEAESELVAGFLTEYSGYRWALFFFAEYAAMFVVCGLVVILFLGGWNSPLPVSWGGAVTEMVGDNLLARGINGLLFSGPIWFVAKCVFFLYVHIWLRWTLPRIRIDQVLYACVQVLLPITMILLLGATLWTWAGASDSGGWAMFDQVVNWILGLVGAVFPAGFVVIAAYGFYHRRRMVGNLAIEALPGS